jgi:hypothetical protein
MSALNPTVKGHQDAGNERDFELIAARMAAKMHDRVTFRGPLVVAGRRPNRPAAIVAAAVANLLPLENSGGRRDRIAAVIVASASFGKRCAERGGADVSKNRGRCRPTTSYRSSGIAVRLLDYLTQNAHPCPNGFHRREAGRMIARALGMSAREMSARRTFSHQRHLIRTQPPAARANPRDAESPWSRWTPAEHD